MAAATVTLANLCDVVCAWHRRPWIRADRDLCALRTAGESDGISRLGMQVVRNELVEALVTFVNQIKLNHSVCTLRFLSHCFEGLQVLFEDRFETTLHFRARRHFFERLDGEFANDLFDE